MECCFCLCLSLSFRGASYFAASVHNYYGLYLLRDLLTKIIYPKPGTAIWEKEGDVDGDAMRMLLLLIYIFLFLFSGMFIFKGIEKEVKKVIQIALVGFLVVQILALSTLFFLYDWHTFQWTAVEHGVYSVLYCFVLGLYCKKLKTEDNLWKM